MCCSLDLALSGFHLFGPLSTWEVADSTVMEKWNWLFVNGCKYKSPVYTAMEFLNSCQDRTNASMCLGIMLKANDTSLD
jgi:hypothetical protein